MVKNVNQGRIWVGSALVVAALALAGTACSTSTKASSSNGTQPGAAESTNPKLYSSRELAGKLLDNHDVDATMALDGPPALGATEVNKGNTGGPTSMTCDGKVVKLPSHDSHYFGMTSENFSTKTEYPSVYEEIDSDHPEELSSDMAAFSRVLAHCYSGSTTSSGGPISLKSNPIQYSLPGSDEHVGYSTVTTYQGETSYALQLLFRRGSIVVNVEYDSATPTDKSVATHLATVAYNKLDGIAS